MTIAMMIKHENNPNSDQRLPFVRTRLSEHGGRTRESLLDQNRHRDRPASQKDDARHHNASKARPAPRPTSKPIPGWQQNIGTGYLDASPKGRPACVQSLRWFRPAPRRLQQKREKKRYEIGDDGYPGNGEYIAVIAEAPWIAVQKTGVFCG